MLLKNVLSRQPRFECLQPISTLARHAPAASSRIQLASLADVTAQEQLAVAPEQQQQQLAVAPEQQQQLAVAPEQQQQLAVAQQQQQVALQTMCDALLDGNELLEAVAICQCFSIQHNDLSKILVSVVIFFILKTDCI